MEKEDSGVPTEKRMQEKREIIRRLEFEPYKLKVDWLKQSKITSLKDIKEVRDFVSSYEPPTDRYKAPKKRLLNEIAAYEAGLKK